MSLNYNKISKYISSSRLKRYEEVCDGDHKKALKLYQTNIRLSQAFYALLTLMEVILRNALNEEMKLYFKDANWLKNQCSGFMSDPKLNHSPKKEFLKKEVEKSLKKVSPYTATPYSPCKIVADMKFGFWTALFDSIHFKILNGAPLGIFINLPPKGNRSLIDKTLTRIRDFRNRIYHNEPIIFGIDSTGATIFDMSKVSEVYMDIQNIFVWLNLDFDTWTIRINNIPFEIKRADCVLNHYPTKKYYFRRTAIGLNHYVQKYVKYHK